MQLDFELVRARRGFDQLRRTCLDNGVQQQAHCMVVGRAGRRKHQGRQEHSSNSGGCETYSRKRPVMALQSCSSPSLALHLIGCQTRDEILVFLKRKD
jgi:hypothetical protein